MGPPQVAAETRQSDWPFESHAERRRAQIVAIAAHLMVQGGVEAVTHAAVAERAGLVRTALYRYFPSRDDLVVAVHDAQVEVWMRRLAHEDTVAGLLGFAAATAEHVPEATKYLARQAWAPEDWNPAALELRIAWLIIVRDIELYARLCAEHPEIAALEANTLSTVFREYGLGEIESQVVRGTLLNANYHAAVAALEGHIDRTDAIRLIYRATLAVLNAFRD
jgi:AcrR family transcriptional regulator